MDRWPSGITGILKATTFFFTFGYRFLLFILFFFCWNYYFDSISWASAHCKIDHWEFRDVFPVSTVFAVWLVTHTRNLSIFLLLSLSLSLSLSLFLSLSVCLFVHLSIYPSFFFILSVHIFLRRRETKWRLELPRYRTINLSSIYWILAGE